MKIRALTTCCLSMCVLFMASHRAAAQIVQLPSLHGFSGSGSMLVPDGGTTLLGSRGYARQGSTNSGFGPQSSRALAGSVGGSTVSASVQIIDLDALDQAILASGAPRTTAARQTPPVASPSAAAAGVGAADTATPAPGGNSRRNRLLSDSLSKLSTTPSDRVAADPSQWQRVLSGSGTPPPVNASMVESNVRYYVELGEQAERSGSVQAARVFYRLARQAMTPQLVERYEAVLRERAAKEAARSTAEQEQASRKF